MPRRLIPLLFVAGACSARPAPYHFRAPLVTSVSASELRSELGFRPVPRLEVREVGMRHPSARGRVDPGPRAPAPVRVTTPSRPLAGEDGDTLADSLRALVGARDAGDHARFAVAAVAAIGADVPGDLGSAPDGPALVERARACGALAETGTPLLGDLLVFDAVTGDEPASLLGVVVSASGDGTIEFVYLARGVVRRGWVNPKWPARKRDEAGRALNTFLRGSDGRDPAGTRYLAGELYRGFIRLDRLLQSRAQAPGWWNRQTHGT